MLSSADNVIPFFSRKTARAGLIRNSDHEFACDLASLKNLSLQLQTARRLFAHSADALNVLCTSALQTNIAEKTDQFRNEIDALQAGTDALISAMATHQRRA